MLQSFFSLYHICITIDVKKPVVVTSVGGLTEVVEDGKSGTVVPPDDVGKLAEALSEMLSNRSKLKDMGQYGFALAQDKYSWGRIAKLTEELYFEAG